MQHSLYYLLILTLHAILIKTSLSHCTYSNKYSSAQCIQFHYELHCPFTVSLIMHPHNSHMFIKPFSLQFTYCRYECSLIIPISSLQIYLNNEYIISTQALSQFTHPQLLMHRQRLLIAIIWRGHKVKFASFIVNHYSGSQVFFPFLI